MLSNTSNTNRTNVWSYMLCVIAGALTLLSTAPAKAQILAGPVPGRAGQVNTLTVSGGVPGDTATFFYGFSAGWTAFNPCPDIWGINIANAQIAGTAVVDATGNATLSAYVPAAASGRTFYLGAIVLPSCQGTNQVVYRFP